MATRDDVARLAGVSSSTVSYTISGRRPISDKTKARVKRAMEELDYTPNAFARGLAGSRLGLIALHYPSSTAGVPSTEFEYVSAMANRAREKGYHLLLWTQPLEDTAGLHSLVSQGIVDGVVLMELVAQDPRVPVMEESGVPFVLVGRPTDTAGLTYVDNDFDDQAVQAMTYLHELGHRVAVFLRPDTKADGRGVGTDARMCQSLTRAAKDLGFVLHLWEAERTPAAGRAILQRILAEEPRPTALLSLNEVAAAGFANAAAVAGMAVPEHFTMIGLNMGDVAADLMLPRMTTVSPSPATLMTKAMDALEKLIEKEPGFSMQELVTPALTIRGSSAQLLREPASRVREPASLSESVSPGERVSHGKPALAGEPS